MDLYRHVPPLVDNTSLSVDPFQVEGLLPTEDKIDWALKLLRNHRSRGPSGIRADHLKGCLVEVRKEKAAAAKKTEA